MDYKRRMLKFRLNFQDRQTLRYMVVEPRSTRDIEILLKLIFKVPVVGNTADIPNPPGLLPF